MVASLRPQTLVLAALTAVQTVGCFGSPTPLAPGLSGSVGLPHQGVLTDAVELPVSGAGFVRFRPNGTRNYGVLSLVAAIARAGQTVQRELPNSPPLVVGDLSSRSGGRISGHSSHRSGRDVDLLFYTTSLQSIPLKSPGFVHFGPDGLARVANGSYVALDIHRNWLITRALLTDSTIDVLWLFVSRDVEAYLIDHARALGEPTDLVLKAERVLHQPRDSANHDDHFHLRIACASEAQVHGCEGGGPAWPWLPSNAPLEPPNLLLPWDYADSAPLP